MKKKILLVEDEEILSQMYKDKLEEAGFRISLARNIAKAKESTKEEKPDLVILDILLPGENGLSFLKWLRENPNFQKVPVIVFSNFDDPETKKEAEGLGILSYVLKTSYTPSQLIEKVNSLIKKS